MKQKFYPQQEEVSRFYYFSPYFELFRTIDIFPIHTLIVMLSPNVMLTVPRELGLPVMASPTFSLTDILIRGQQMNSQVIVSGVPSRRKKERTVLIAGYHD